MVDKKPIIITPDNVHDVVIRGIDIDISFTTSNNKPDRGEIFDNVESHGTLRYDDITLWKLLNVVIRKPAIIRYQDSTIRKNGADYASTHKHVLNVDEMFHDTAGRKRLTPTIKADRAWDDMSPDQQRAFIESKRAELNVK